MDDFQMRCLRKHFLCDQVYLLRIEDDKVTISKPSSSVVKYSIQLTWSTKISWQMRHKRLSAFGFEQSKDHFKWFNASFEDLVQLMKRLSTRVTFTELNSLYEIKAYNQFQVYYLQRIQTVKSLIDDRSYGTKYFFKDQLIRQDDYDTMYFELDIIRHLHHPNIQAFHEFWDYYNAYIILNNRIMGQNLDTYIKEQGHFIHQRTVQQMMQQILSGLKYLHDQQIIHRNICPENIYYNPVDETVKIINFGLATKSSCTKFKHHKCGTPGFMAPEVLNHNNKNYSPLCDIFSLGCIFYKLLVKKDIFSGRNEDETLNSNKQFKMNLPALALIKIPEAPFELLTAMLEMNPQYRIDAASALQHRYFTEPLINLSKSSGSSRSLRRLPIRQEVSLSKFQQTQSKLEVDYQDIGNLDLPPRNQIPILNIQGGVQHSQLQ